jgi:hypothetical protein
VNRRGFLKLLPWAAVAPVVAVAAASKLRAEPELHTEVMIPSGGSYAFVSADDRSRQILRIVNEPPRPFPKTYGRSPSSCLYVDTFSQRVDVEKWAETLLNSEFFSRMASKP